MAEEFCLDRATSISGSDAVRLANVYGNQGSANFMEMLDRVIGNNIEDLTAKEVCSSFIAFTQMNRAAPRPKFLNLLTKRMSQTIDQLSARQLLDLTVRINQIDEDGTSQLMGDLDLEKLMISRMNQLNCFTGDFDSAIQLLIDGASD